MNIPIYLDNNATTPMDPRVLEAMLPYFTNKFGNAASRNHHFGWVAEEGVDYAREQVAKLIGASEKEIIFTSGATESDNLAIKGVFEMYKDKGNHIITAVTEHKAVLDACKHIEKLGGKVTYLPVKEDGLVDLAELEAAMTPETILVSIMYGNNEIGVIQPVKEIAAIAHKHGALFMTDATQAVGKIPVDVNADGIDLLALSAHKMYGPSGLGVLYMKDKWIDEFTPYQGGGQMIQDVDIDKSTYANGYEKFEAGTPPIAPVIGFSSSLNFMNEIDPNVIYDHEMKLHDYAYEKLSKFNNIKIYGSNKNKGAIISFNIEGVHNTDLGAMLDKKNIAIRTGHHCCQPLMKHLNVSGTSRISFGIYNTKDDVDYLIDSIDEIIKILL